MARFGVRFRFEQIRPASEETAPPVSASDRGRHEIQMSALQNIYGCRIEEFPPDMSQAVIRLLQTAGVSRDLDLMNQEVINLRLSRERLAQLQRFLHRFFVWDGYRGLWYFRGREEAIPRLRRAERMVENMPEIGDETVNEIVRGLVAFQDTCVQFRQYLEENFQELPNVRIWRRRNLEDQFERARRSRELLDWIMPELANPETQRVSGQTVAALALIERDRRILLAELNTHFQDDGVGNWVRRAVNPLSSQTFADALLEIQPTAIVVPPGLEGMVREMSQRPPELTPQDYTTSIVAIDPAVAQESLRLLDAECDRVETERLERERQRRNRRRRR